MHIEMLCAQEAFRLLKRGPAKYINRVTGLYLLSLADPKIGRTARASYYFVRHIDDLLDGDTKINSNLLDYTLELRSHIEQGTPTKIPISSLADYAIAELEKKALPEDNPRKDFIDSIDSMMFDHIRSKSRQTLTQQELDQYYWQTFSSVLNIMTIGVGSNIRAVDIPEMSYCQGRVYSARDLDDDWNTGIINISHEILTEGGLTSFSSVSDVKSNATTKSWLIQDLQRSKTDLDGLQSRLQTRGDPLTVRVCNRLIDPMYKLIERYS